MCEYYKFLCRIDRIPNKVILEKFGANKLSSMIEERQWSYYGHIYRKPENQWVNFTMDATLRTNAPGNLFNWRKQMDNLLNEAKTACENINIENENDRIIFDKKLAKDHGKWASIYKTLISYRADILNPAA